MNGPKRRPGRRPKCPPDVAVRIVSLRQQGLSYQAIGDLLTTERIPTPMGRSQWSKSHVNRVLHTMYVRDIIDGSRGTVKRVPR
jgi:hypothetical protein